MERDHPDRHGNDIVMSPQGDVTPAACIAFPLPASSLSIVIRPALEDSGTDSPQRLPSDSFTFEVVSDSNNMHLFYLKIVSTSVPQ
jgi:hypothetical protein